MREIVLLLLCACPPRQEPPLTGTATPSATSLITAAPQPTSAELHVVDTGRSSFPTCPNEIKDRLVTRLQGTLDGWGCGHTKESWLEVSVLVQQGIGNFVMKASPVAKQGGKTVSWNVIPFVSFTGTPTAVVGDCVLSLRGWLKRCPEYPDQTKTMIVEIDEDAKALPGYSGSISGFEGTCSLDNSFELSVTLGGSPVGITTIEPARSATTKVFSALPRLDARTVSKADTGGWPSPTTMLVGPCNK